MISPAGIADAVNMNAKGAKIYAAAMMRNAQMKISMIKDWVEVLFFVLFPYFAIAKSLSIMDFLGSERFELQPREEEHHAEEDDTHGAR